MTALRALLLGLALAAGPSGAQTPEAPARVVSMNLCTDQLAMMLAAPGQLISVSNIANDPLVSPMAEEAAAYPANFGGAEEIFLLEPDLVVAANWSDPSVISMLRRLDIPVAQIDLATSLDDIPARIAEMGALLHRQAEAATVIARFEADLAALRSLDEGPRAAFYYPNGYTLGTSGLSHEILTAAGFRHIAEEVGRSFGSHLALEMLILSAPDLIISATPYAGVSRSEEVLRHPALRSLIAAAHGTVSGPEWVCGTPHVIGALGHLRQTRDEIAATWDATR